MKNISINLKELYRNRNKKLLMNGKISILEPDKIEKQSILTSLLKAKVYAKGILLDLGCGGKPYEIIFSDIVEEYIGIDLPPTKTSNKQIKKPDVYGSALKLPFKSESFDTILCTQVLEHVPEPKKLLEEAFRVLKGDGYLIMTAPMT